MIQPVYYVQGWGLVRVCCCMCFEIRQRFEDSVPLRQGLGSAEHCELCWATCSTLQGWWGP